jgi:hypothetical protein
MTEAGPECRFARSILMSRKAVIKYRILLRRGEEEGACCLELYITKRLPWEVCHKHRNIRREKPAGATSVTE